MKSHLRQQRPTVGSERPQADRVGVDACRQVVHNQLCQHGSGAECRQLIEQGAQPAGGVDAVFQPFGCRLLASSSERVRWPVTLPPAGPPT
jgi:hypothetical protein